jgi:hypothetical protein
MLLIHFQYTTYNAKFYKPHDLKNEKELKIKMLKITGHFLFDTWKKIRRCCCNVLLVAYHRVCPGGLLPSGQQMSDALIALRRIFFDAGERQKLVRKRARESVKLAVLSAASDVSDEQLQEECDLQQEEEDRAADPQSDDNDGEQLPEEGPALEYAADENPFIAAAREKRFLKFFMLNWLPFVRFGPPASDEGEVIFSGTMNEDVYHTLVESRPLNRIT